MEFSHGGVTVEVFTGDDGATVVQLTTDFEPNEGDLRVWLNEASLFDSKGDR